MLKIYLTNLGKYNEGILSGEWLELPATSEEVEAVKNRTGYDETHEEYFITDYESNIDLTIGEFDDIDELNELAELIEQDPEAVEALLYFGYDTPEEIRENIDRVLYICEEGYNEDYEIGYAFAEELGYIDIPENIKSYFDYEAYGRDIRLEGSFCATSSGSIYELMC